MRLAPEGGAKHSDCRTGCRLAKEWSSGDEVRVCLRVLLRSAPRGLLAQAPVPALGKLIAPANQLCSGTRFSETIRLGQISLCEQVRRLRFQTVPRKWNCHRNLA